MKILCMNQIPIFQIKKMKIGKKVPPKKLCLEINEIIFTNVLYEHLSFIFGQTRDKTCIG
jgi:hypothetical protein